ncbi:hypothetical protein [Dyella sp. 20L07]|uniref:hypothetical protein n=1 Tax=Dyella sp. 20L07 TaxID=3384240 RepID=UPI003D28BBB9
MSSSITERIVRLLACAVVLLVASGAYAQDTITLSKVLQVCVRSASGLTAHPKQGIDAVEGKIVGGGGTVDFLISTNPNLPAGMNIKKGRGGLVLPELSGEATFIAESTGPLGLGATGQPIGYGTERLYAFTKEMMETPIGPRPHRIFIQLWSDSHRRNTDLLKKVGDSLYRCQ